MESGQQPATKQDLLELEHRTKQDLRELEHRLEERLTGLIRDTETNLLRAFYGFAEVTQ